VQKLNFPGRVTVIDVSPRDGLQSLKTFIPTKEKVRLIKGLIAAGIPKIEATSFVSPMWVPQLADAEEVLENLNEHKASIQVLVLNQKGYERAQRTGLVREITFVVAGTETLNRKNVNMSIADSMRQFASISGMAKADGIRVRGIIGVAFICPHEGRVPAKRTLELIEKFYNSGAEEVTLADSLGAATPDQVYDLFAQGKGMFPDKSFAGHFHDTQHFALANILAALQAGVDIFESAVGELGGCQFTVGAKGNVATERLVNMLHGMGIETGIDYDRLLEVSKFARLLPSLSEAHSSKEYFSDRELLINQTT
jgi:hydroxymethylglutaryl-CoA lyase